jgi:hypothetical protein
MAVHLIALAGQEPFDRLIADPGAAGLPGEVESAVGYTGFWLHVLWPQNDALYAIVEGDGEVHELVGLLAENVAGGGWDADVSRVPDAEDPPEDLEAGAQDQWVIDTVSLVLPAGAIEPAARQCDLCLRAAVPPHQSGCPAERSDGDVALPRELYPTTDRGGGADELETPELAETALQEAPVA